MTDMAQPTPAGRGPNLRALITPAPHQVEQDKHEQEQEEARKAAPQVAPDVDEPKGVVADDPAEQAPAAPPTPTPVWRDPSELTRSLHALRNQPRATGWRKWLRLSPSPKDIAQAERRSTLLTTFPQGLTVAVVNPKGGAGKTPTARGIGAAFGVVRGGEAVVVDVNELRGTLGSRSVTVGDGHIGKVLEAAEYLLGHRASSSEIEELMHKQPHSHEWVLPADPSTTEPMSIEAFGQLHEILRRFFPILAFDTGNAELAPSWQATTRAAQVLVVPTKWKHDHVEPVVRMLSAMDSRGERIEGRVIIVGTNGPGEADPDVRREALRHFDRLPMVEVPVDPALNQGPIRWPDLSPKTQAAFEQLAALIVTTAKETPRD